MKKNIIIAIETITIIILIVILLNNGSNEKEAKEEPIEDPNKAVIGIYHNEQDNQTIRLEENNLCVFLQEHFFCSYSVENNIIKLHITYFVVDADNIENLTLIKSYKTMSECNEDLTKEKAYKNLKNIRCKEQELNMDREARIVNNGLLVSDKIYTKIA